MKRGREEERKKGRKKEEEERRRGRRRRRRMKKKEEERRKKNEEEKRKKESQRLDLNSPRLPFSLLISTVSLHTFSIACLIFLSCVLDSRAFSIQL